MTAAEHRKLFWEWWTRGVNAASVGSTHTPAFPNDVAERGYRGGQEAYAASAMLECPPYMDPTKTDEKLERRLVKYISGWRAGADGADKPWDEDSLDYLTGHNDGRDALIAAMRVARARMKGEAAE